MELDYDPATGVARWDILSLDPMTLEPTDDAMMGILSVGGMGEVTFDISLKPGLANGTQIANKATIWFDQESSIDTPVFTNTMDYTLPESHIADGTQDADSVTLVIEGSDTGSGIWHYDVYQQIGTTGSWVKVAADVEAGTVAVERPAGATDVGYCVIATDKAGNCEDKELHRELAFSDMLAGDTNRDGVVNITDYVNLIDYINRGELPGVTFSRANADVNGDGLINITDAVGIIEIINNK